MNVDLSHAHLRKDAHIAMLLDTVQMPDFTPSGRIYYDLLESIVSQQLSVKAATTIFNRFCTLFPDNYPHPEMLVEVEVARLREMGLSYQKAGYLQNVARFSLENDLESHGWEQMSDEEIIEFLTQIKGVGKWTVQMLLMFTLGRPDVFPIDDLGIQQAMINLYKINETGKELRKKMLELSAPWQPWRTIACRYLWRWKDAAKTVS